MNPIHIELTKKPNMLPVYVAGWLRKRSSLKEGEQVPAMTARWQGYRIDRRHLHKFLALTGLSGDVEIPFMYPLVLVFPIHMCMLAHPAFPFPYFRMLQVRSHLQQYRLVHTDEVLDMYCSVVNQHVVARGIELDFKTVFSNHGHPVWELVNTYFMPGKFGAPGPASHLAHFEPLPEDPSVIHWRFSPSIGLSLGHLAGDYNGLHYSSAYAHKLGYQRDFAHSQLTLAQCIQRLPILPENRQIQLSMALKGPVYYDHEVLMKYSIDQDHWRFDLFCSDNPRPSFAANISVT
ncbi:MAG: hypothetical protein ACM3UZ_10520 [Acidobacteriota bacterium]